MIISNCTKCNLHKYRDQLVIGRGDMPADLLYIGEAPGINEDAIGESFVGIGGEVLDIMMNDAFVKSTLKKMPTFFITNCVLCRPTDKKGGANRKPKVNEILACMENVTKIIEEVNPKITILIGKVSERFYKGHFPHYKQVIHPAALSRCGGVIDPRYKRNVRLLVEIFDSLT